MTKLQISFDRTSSFGRNKVKKRKADNACSALSAFIIIIE